MGNAEKSTQLRGLGMHDFLIMVRATVRYAAWCMVPALECAASHTPLFCTAHPTHPAVRNAAGRLAEGD